jgi:alpha-methylacyl-CoA racemase
VLSGIRVLDLTRLLPGAYATQLLRDLGADVIKIEDPWAGDYMRRLGPLAGGLSVGFVAVNRGKQSCALNLRDERGRALFFRLVERCDAVLEGFRPGVADRLGIGYAAVASQNARIVYCSLTGYGQSGPNRLRPGHDITYLAETGILGESRDSTGAPIAPGVQIADLAGGMMAAIAMLAALLEARTTGRGRYLDVAMCDVLASWVAPLLVAAAASALTGPPANWLSGRLVCYHVYRTKDGRYVALGALERKFWDAFCRAAGCERLIPAHLTPALDENPAYRELRAIFAGKSAAEWASFAKAVDTILAVVRSPGEVLVDEQLASRGVLVAARDGTVPVVGAAVLPAACRSAMAAADTPAHGQHTRVILREIGLSDEDIAALAREGVIALGGSAQ